MKKKSTLKKLNSTLAFMQNSIRYIFHFSMEN